MAKKVTFKSLILLALLAVFCMVILNIFFTHRPIRRVNTSRLVHITAKDLMAMRHDDPCDDEGVIPQPMDIPAGLSTSYSPLSNGSVGTSHPCGNYCQKLLNKTHKAGDNPPSNVNTAVDQQQHKLQTNNNMRLQCNRSCAMNKLKEKGIATRQNPYISRVQVENMTLPRSWTVTAELKDRLSQRQRHVQATCEKYGLDKANVTYQPNAWEFIINEDHNLVWCNVFKAASSTWFYNFNLLAGFSEFELLHTKESPVTLARKYYKRPTVEELKRILNRNPPPLSFMIVRHPFERLVSGYRDKILSGNRFYSKLSRIIARTYQNLSSVKEMDGKLPKLGRVYGRKTVASFPQFVQFLLDETAQGNKLDEHWTPMSTFCTPCLVPFDVFAKVETLEEDGNYIIYSSGISEIIKPKRINRSRNGPTQEVANKFLCQLTKIQMEGLIKMFKLDLELFEYDASKYRECVR